MSKAIWRHTPHIGYVLSLTYLVLICGGYLTGCVGSGPQTTGDRVLDAKVRYESTLKELILLRDTNRLNTDQKRRMKDAVKQAREARIALDTLTDPALRNNSTLLFLQGLTILEGLLVETQGGQP